MIGVRTYINLLTSQMPLIFNFKEFKSSFLNISKFNSLYDKKTWGTTAVAHTSQSSILAATYNIIRFLTEILESQFGIREEKLIKKRDKALEKRALNANKKGNKINILEIVLPYMFQISQQFIRLIRNIIFECSFLKAEFSKFKKRMETY